MCELEGDDALQSLDTSFGKVSSSDTSVIVAFRGAFRGDSLQSVCARECARGSPGVLGRVPRRKGTEGVRKRESGSLIASLCLAVLEL